MWYWGDCGASSKCHSTKMACPTRGGGCWRRAGALWDVWYNYDSFFESPGVLGKLWTFERSIWFEGEGNAETHRWLFGNRTTLSSWALFFWLASSHSQLSISRHETTYPFQGKENNFWHVCILPQTYILTMQFARKWKLSLHVHEDEMSRNCLQSVCVHATCTFDPLCKHLYRVYLSLQRCQRLLVCMRTTLWTYIT